MKPPLDHTGPNEVRPLLACGHYGGRFHANSSIFDFPADPIDCPRCGEQRQFHLDLQLAIYASWEVER